ncbi:MAG: DUF1592 domain-containing protein [Planctomycetota bacterium]
MMTSARMPRQSKLERATAGRTTKHERLFVCTLVVLLPFVLGGQIRSAELDPSIPQFVQRYCMSCHDSKQAKGDRSFESFLKAPGDQDQVATIEEMLDLINLGAMPPVSKRARQPGDAERREVVLAMTKYLAAASLSHRPSATVLRRLSRREYNNTMRDLLGVHPDQSDATRLFPIDQRHDGFTNVGSAQVLSDYQLRLYMKAARFYLDQAFVFGRSKPRKETWTFEPASLSGQDRNVGTVFYQVWAKDGSFIDIGHGEPVDRYPTHPRRFARQGVPSDGVYRIRVKATAVGREHPYDSSIYSNDLSVPLKMGVWHVPNPDLLKKGASEGRVLVKVFDLPDDEVSDFEATAWMPAGSIPFVNWINGMGPSKRVMERVIERYHPEATRKSQTKVDRLREQGLPVPKDALVQKVWISDLYQGPRVRVFEMALEGPLIDQWPPEGHRRIFGDRTSGRDLKIPSSIHQFAQLAFRRPLEQAEVRHYVQHAEQRLAEGATLEEAIKSAFAAILCSPRFLYLDEGDPSQSESLDSIELASRLSYTLWGSMPDEQLLEAAIQGRLVDPEELMTETNRMLRDVRSDFFVRQFTESWLRLDRIGTMPPSDAQYPTYYDNRLESAMKAETRLFFKDILINNRSASEFLDSEFTWVNDSLASHYGLDGEFSEQFRRVSLAADDHRGGLLGHASVLTATANGVETSPVVRGLWILESILGTPPSPPPPDVPPIEPDTRGATTIREQLAKHRSVTACADCHAKIDPWGFALEFYDPIGGFRTSYPVVNKAGRIVANQSGKAIDARGELPSGDLIRDQRELKQLLVARRDQFARNLVHKLLTYATGREVTFRDQEEIRQIVKRFAEDGYRMRDMVVAVVTSDAFQRR